MITSPANKKVKEVRALFDKASLRAERGLFPIEGVRMFLEAPAAARVLRRAPRGKFGIK